MVHSYHCYMLNYVIVYLIDVLIHHGKLCPARSCSDVHVELESLVFSQICDDVWTESTSLTCSYWSGRQTV
jgi:hypothetical protein